MCHARGITYVFLSNVTSNTTTPLFDAEMLGVHIDVNKGLSCLVENDDNGVFEACLVDGSMSSVHSSRVPNITKRFSDVGRYIVDVEVLHESLKREWPLFCRRTTYKEQIVKSVNFDISYLTEQFDTCFIIK